MAQAQSVTIEQLARIYQARNEANKRMSQALRIKSGMAEAKAEAGRLNRAYVDALKVYKRQQKTARNAREKTTSAQKTTAEHPDANAT
jgi:hypothetical protein